MTEQTTPLAPISVEVLFLRVNAEGGWAYRRIVTLPTRGESPDEAARRVCGVARGAPSTVVHSTSWRYRPEGQVVLTYAVCPDPAPQAAAIELSRPRVARGDGPASPSPADLRVEDVAAHAVHHLAFLMTTDPVVRAALGRSPAVTAALEGLSPALAGELVPHVADGAASATR
ncbi:hypothetical protein GCM10017673_08160 [Streptosporangium violaceochromogenes]|nr:hypothetical protein GCM10017673_08160 [Streptosporangium violaceochromogenes]